MRPFSSNIPFVGVKFDVDINFAIISYVFDILILILKQNVSIHYKQ